MVSIATVSIHFHGNCILIPIPQLNSWLWAVPIKRRREKRPPHQTVVASGKGLRPTLCHGQTNLKCLEGILTCFPYLRALTYKIALLSSHLAPPKQSTVHELPLPGRLQDSRRASTGFGSESLSCQLLALWPLSVSFPLRAVFFLCKTGILILSLCLPCRLNNVWKMPDTG